RRRDPQREDLAGRLERETSLRPEEVERVHVVSVDGNWRHGWVVGRSVASLDRSRVLNRLQNRRTGRHAGRRYHVGTPAGSEELAVHFAGPNVLVIATEDGMKRCLDQATSPV